MRATLLGVCSVVLAGVAGCSEAAAPESFVGTTGRNGELAVAIVVDSGGGVLAYACDGASEDHWFEVSATEVEGQRTVELESADGATLVATVTEVGAEGTLEAEGVVYDLALDPVRDIDAGLYRSEGQVGGEAFLTGWVVQNDGSQVGVTRIGTTKQPAPTLTAMRRPTISQH